MVVLSRRVGARRAEVGRALPRRAQDALFRRQRATAAAAAAAAEASASASCREASVVAEGAAGDEEESVHD